jgi:enoyl-[acyl-carrier protein] reductase III
MNDQWGIIIGGSTGIGLSSAKKLASSGFNLVILHRNRRVEMPAIEESFDTIRNLGAELYTLNVNALDQAAFDKMESFLVSTKLKAKINFCLHAVAMGNIGPLSGENALDRDSILSTIHAMGVNFLEWGRFLMEGGWFAKDAAMVGLTSEGNKKVMKGYAAVASAKAVLETLCKYMAIEFAGNEVRVNVVQAGITDTNALRVLPNPQKIIESAKNKHPYHRITTVGDVANTIYLLSLPESKWINGTVITVDGGEQISG